MYLFIASMRLLSELLFTPPLCTMGSYNNQIERETFLLATLFCLLLSTHSSTTLKLILTYATDNIVEIADPLWHRTTYDVKTWKRILLENGMS